MCGHKVKSGEVTLRRTECKEPSFMGLCLWWTCLPRCDGTAHVGQPTAFSTCRTIRPIFFITFLHEGWFFTARDQFSESISVGLDFLIHWLIHPRVKFIIVFHRLQKTYCLALQKLKKILRFYFPYLGLCFVKELFYLPTVKLLSIKNKQAQC